MKLRSHLARAYALAPRSLAAFRVALACVLVLELVVLRWPALRPFYSDAGVLPLAVVLRALVPKALACGEPLGAQGVGMGTLGIGGMPDCQPVRTLAGVIAAHAVVLKAPIDASYGSSKNTSTQPFLA